MIAFYSLKLKAKQPFAQVVGSIKLLLKNNKMSIKENKTKDIKKYLKDYYTNKKVMVKCDRCDCEVNSFSLKQHYKTRLCTRITKLSE